MVNNFNNVDQQTETEPKRKYKKMLPFIDTRCELILINQL